MNAKCKAVCSKGFHIVTCTLELVTAIPPRPQSGTEEREDSFVSDSVVLQLDFFGAWRSLVAHLLWEQRVEGSNPFAPTK